MKNVMKNQLNSSYENGKKLYPYFLKYINKNNKNNIFNYTII